MKLILATLFVLSAQGAFAREIHCNGKKHFSSPYPGASSTATVILKIDEVRESVDLTLRSSVSATTETFRLTDLRESRGVFRFRGEGEGKLSGTINFLSPTGVTAKLNRFKNLEYNCSVFRVID